MTQPNNTVLLVDDAQEVLDLLDNILTSYQYQVLKARDGREGLEVARKQIPGLILTDVLMPGMDGFTFYKELKRNKETADIPIIVLTVRERMQDTFLALGATDFVSKPFDVNGLLVKIRAGLNSSKLAMPKVEPKEKEQRIPSQTELNPQEKGPKLQQEESRPDPVSFKKKALIAGNSPEVNTLISRILQKFQFGVTIVKHQKHIIDDFRDLQPDMMVFDVLMNNAPVDNVIKRLKKLPNFKNHPIITFSYLNKNLQNKSVHQQASDIDKARRLCLEAGATEYMGGFDEPAFTQIIKRYADL
jgi:two-component system phosphate regulon response regulator PhoB